MLEPVEVKRIVEAALLAAHEPVPVARLEKLFAAGELPDENPRQLLRDTLAELSDELTDRGIELVRVGSGYRFQVRQSMSPWVSRLWDEKPPRYSRALLETLALVAYRQPVTRGDIEQVRGVSVSPNIMRTLQDRGWIRAVGQREAPGRPSMYGTTREFLDYFNLKSLDELPPLNEIRALIEPVLEEAPAGPVDPSERLAEDASAAAEVDEPSADGPRLAEVVHLPTADH